MEVEPSSFFQQNLSIIASSWHVNSGQEEEEEEGSDDDDDNPSVLVYRWSALWVL